VDLKKEILVINKKIKNTIHYQTFNQNKMKNLLIVSIILLMVFAAQAQDVKKGFRLQESGDYEKAETEFMTLYRVNKYNAAASFGLALTYSSDSYQKKDYFAAYNYAKQTLNNFDKLKNDDLEDLKKYLTKEKVEEQLVVIDGKLFQDVEASKDYTKLKRYLNECQGSAHYREAMNMRYEFEFAQAKEKNTEAAFDEFIKNNPYSDEIKEAKKLREVAAFEETKKKGTEAAFTAFLEKYPKAEVRDEAIKLRVDAAYNEAKQKNTVESYSGFMDKYPKATQTEEIKKELNKAAFERMKNNNSYEAFNEYLSTAPAGALYLEAFNLKANFMSSEYLQQSNFNQNILEWLRVFDDNGKNDRATSIKVSASGTILVSGYSEQKTAWFNDGWLGAFNADGSILWDYKLITETDDKINDVAPAVFNAVYAAGRKGARFRSDNEFAWIAKFDATGKLQWETVVKGSNAVSIAATPQGDAVVSGYTDKADGNRDLWVCKVTKAGKVEWRQEFAAYGEPVKVLVQQSGNVCVVAQFRCLLLGATGAKVSELKFDDNYKAYNAEIVANGDVFIAGRFYNFKEETETKSNFWAMKLTGGKTKMWSNTFDNASLHDIATSIAVAPNGNIVLAGTTAQQNDNFKDDIWVIELNASGTKTSDYSFGTDDNEKNPLVLFNSAGKYALYFSKDFNSDNVLIMIK